MRATQRVSRRMVQHMNSTFVPRLFSTFKPDYREIKKERMRKLAAQTQNYFFKKYSPNSGFFGSSKQSRISAAKGYLPVRPIHGIFTDQESFDAGILQALDFQKNYLFDSASAIFDRLLLTVLESYKPEDWKSNLEEMPERMLGTLPLSEREESTQQQLIDLLNAIHEPTAAQYGTLVQFYIANGRWKHCHSLLKNLLSNCELDSSSQEMDPFAELEGDSDSDEEEGDGKMLVSELKPAFGMLSHEFGVKIYKKLSKDFEVSERNTGRKELFRHIWLQNWELVKLFNIHKDFQLLSDYIDMFNKVGEKELATELFHLIKKPQRINYDSMIQRCSFDEGMIWLAKLKADPNHKNRPSSRTFAKLLTLACQSGELSKIHVLLDEMKEARISFLYDWNFQNATLVQILHIMQQKEAYQEILDISENHPNADIDCLEIIMKAAVKLERPEIVMEIMSKQIRAGHTPRHAMCSLYAKAKGLSGDREAYKSAFQDFHRNKVHLKHMNIDDIIDTCEKVASKEIASHEATEYLVQNVPLFD